MLIVTSAVIAAGVAATGCAAQRPVYPTTAAATMAIETTSETEAATATPYQEEEKAEEKTFANDDVPVADKISEIKRASQGNEVFPDAPVETTKKTAKKTSEKKTVKTAKKTTKKASKKTAADNERLLIVKTARADALNNAANYKNMNEKIAAAKQASAKKAAAQKNADSRKDMNKAAEDAQKAAKTEAEKQYVKKITQKAGARTAEEKIGNANKKAARKANAIKRKIQGTREAASKKAATKSYERTAKRLGEKSKKHLKESAKKQVSEKNRSGRYNFETAGQGASKYEVRIIY